MAISYQQTDLAADCGAMAACSGGTVSATPMQSELVEGGTPGTTAVSTDLPAGATQVTTFMQTTGGVGITSWDAGDYTIRLNITTANSNVNWTGVWVCRVNSACTSQATVASNTAMSQSLGATGVQSVTVAGSQQTAAETDDIYVVCRFQNTHSHSSQTVGITRNQLIDAPLNVPTSVSESASVSATALPDAVETTSITDLPVTDGLVNQYDLQSDAHSFTDGQLVSSLNDEIGGLTVTAASGNEPTFSATALNQNPALDFNSDMMTSALRAAVIAQPLTVVMVFSADTLAMNQFMVATAPGGSRASMGVTGGNQYQLFAGSFLRDGPTDTDWHVAIGQFNGADSGVFEDGVRVSTGDPGAEGSDSVRLGANAGGAARFDGKLGEVAIYDRVLTEQERTDITAHLQSKWSRPASAEIASVSASATPNAVDNPVFPSVSESASVPAGTSLNAWEAVPQSGGMLGTRQLGEGQLGVETVPSTGVAESASAAVTAQPSAVESSGATETAVLTPTATANAIESITSPAATVIDDFEDGDLAEYVSPNNTAGQFSVQGTTVHDGALALFGDQPATNVAYLKSTSGLDYYPQSGDTFEFWWRPSGDSTYNIFFFGVQNATQTTNHYEIVTHLGTDTFALEADVGGTDTVLDTATIADVTGAAWYRIEVDWHDTTAGVITVRMENAGGTELHQLTATDSTYSEGGIGYFVGAQNVSDGHWDSVQTVGTQSTTQFESGRVPVTATPATTTTATSAETAATSATVSFGALDGAAAGETAALASAVTASAAESVTTPPVTVSESATVTVNTAADALETGAAGDAARAVASAIPDAVESGRATEAVSVQGLTAFDAHSVANGAESAAASSMGTPRLWDAGVSVGETAAFPATATPTVTEQSPSNETASANANGTPSAAENVSFPGGVEAASLTATGAPTATESASASDTSATAVTGTPSATETPNYPAAAETATVDTSATASVSEQGVATDTAALSAGVSPTTTETSAAGEQGTVAGIAFSTAVATGSASESAASSATGAGSASEGVSFPLGFEEAKFVSTATLTTTETATASDVVTVESLVWPQGADTATGAEASTIALTGTADAAETTSGAERGIVGATVGAASAETGGATESATTTVTASASATSSVSLPGPFETASATGTVGLSASESAPSTDRASAAVTAQPSAAEGASYPSAAESASLSAGVTPDSSERGVVVGQASVGVTGAPVVRESSVVVQAVGTRVVSFASASETVVWQTPDESVAVPVSMSVSAVDASGVTERVVLAVTAGFSVVESLPARSWRSSRSGVTRTADAGPDTNRTVSTGDGRQDAEDTEARDGTKTQ